MNYKKKALAIITTASLVSAFAVSNVEAKENWEQRSIEDVKSEVQNLNDEFVYTIQYGDTLGVIAKAIDVDVDKLVEVNSIQNADLIIAGDELRISENKETVTVETETGDVSSYDISEEVVEVEPVAVEEEEYEVAYEQPQAEEVPITYTDSEASAKEWIGQRESGGDYNAYNPAGGYYGKYQLNPTLVAYGASPAEQEIAAQKYVNERYNGSWVQAKAHWEENNWY
jgi:LysM repeat protein